MSGFGGRGPGGARARDYISPMLKDPDVRVGRLRILPRADGMTIVYDPKRPPGDRTVATAGNIDAAKEIAETLEGGKDVEA